MLNKLLKLSRTLRSASGCPWDQKQRMKDIPKQLIEESEEIAQAITKKDWENLKEEIGDVLLNLSRLMVIAEEKKLFTPQEVFTTAAKKVVDRHTWVFGKDKAKTVKDVLKLWKRNKLISRN